MLLLFSVVVQDQRSAPNEETTSEGFELFSTTTWKNTCQFLQIDLGCGNHPQNDRHLPVRQRGGTSGWDTTWLRNRRVWSSAAVVRGAEGRTQRAGTGWTESRERRDMNLQTGPRNGLSYSSAPATYMTRPNPSSNDLMITVLEAATSEVHFMNQSARHREIPNCLVRCNISNPTQLTVSPAVFVHDKGTPVTAHQMKKEMRANL